MGRAYARFSTSEAEDRIITLDVYSLEVRMKIPREDPQINFRDVKNIVSLYNVQSIDEVLTETDLDQWEININLEGIDRRLILAL